MVLDLLRAEISNKKRELQADLFFGRGTESRLKFSALLMFRNTDPIRAKNIFESLVKTHSGFHDLHAQGGLIYAELGDYRTARDQFHLAYQYKVDPRTGSKTRTYEEIEQEEEPWSQP